MILMLVDGERDASYLEAKTKDIFSFSINFLFFSNFISRSFFNGSKSYFFVGVSLMRN